jgi:hypothetical protein
MIAYPVFVVAVYQAIQSLSARTLEFQIQLNLAGSIKA